MSDFIERPDKPTKKVRTASKPPAKTNARLTKPHVTTTNKPPASKND
jgi:hypothetical protein